MINRLLLWFFFSETGYETKILKVKSWKPWWGPEGIEWPVMLIERNGYSRETVVPVVGSYLRYHLRRLK